MVVAKLRNSCKKNCSRKYETFLVPCEYKYLQYFQEIQTYTVLTQ